MKFGFFILLSLVMGIAHASEPVGCDLPEGFCKYDAAFLEREGKIQYIQLGQSSWPDTSLGSKPYSKLASLHHDHCAKNARREKICPGERVQFGAERGIVLGTFKNGDLVFSASGKELRRVPAKRLKIFTASELGSQEVQETLRGLTDLNSILEVGVKLNCDLAGVVARATQVSEPGDSKMDCDEISAPVTAEDSPNREKFAALLAKGVNAPLEDFLMLWYPERGEKNAESPYFECENPVDGMIEVADHCRPESLYSWGPQMKLEQMKSFLPDGAAWKGKVNISKIGFGAIYTTLSPASTFGYGNVLVRIKPKSNAKFLPWEKYDPDRDGPIIELRDGFFHDIKVRGGKVIDSWSYGTPEIYDEVVRDILRFQSGKRVSVYTSPPYGSQGLSRLYDQNPDNNRQDEVQLKTNLIELIRQILMKEGRIHYTEGACRNRERHYSAERPTYFNPIRRK